MECEAAATSCWLWAHLSEPDIKFRSFGQAKNDRSRPDKICKPRQIYGTKSYVQIASFSS